MHFQLPARITKFSPVLDGKWVLTNTDIDVSKPIESTERNDRVIIEDLENNERYSLHDLEQKLTPVHRGEDGNFSKEYTFKNAYIHYGTLKLKLVSYKIEYTIGKPFQQPIQIDFSKELIGVIEYLEKNTKKSVYRNGIIK